MGGKSLTKHAGYFTPGECTSWCPLNKGAWWAPETVWNCSAAGPLHYQKIWNVMLCSISDTSRFFFILLLKIINLYYTTFWTSVKMTVTAFWTSVSCVCLYETQFVFYKCKAFFSVKDLKLPYSCFRNKSVLILFNMPTDCSMITDFVTK